MKKYLNYLVAGIVFIIGYGLVTLAFIFQMSIDSIR